MAPFTGKQVKLYTLELPSSEYSFKNKIGVSRTTHPWRIFRHVKDLHTVGLYIQFLIVESTCHVVILKNPLAKTIVLPLNSCWKLPYVFLCCWSDFTEWFHQVPHLSIRGFDRLMCVPLLWGQSGPDRHTGEGVPGVVVVPHTAVHLASDQPGQRQLLVGMEQRRIRHKGYTSSTTW